MHWYDRWEKWWFTSHRKSFTPLFPSMVKEWSLWLMRRASWGRTLSETEPLVGWMRLTPSFITHLQGAAWLSTLAPPRRMGDNYEEGIMTSSAFFPRERRRQLRAEMIIAVTKDCLSVFDGAAAMVSNNRCVHLLHSGGLSAASSRFTSYLCKTPVNLRRTSGLTGGVCVRMYL